MPHRRILATVKRRRLHARRLRCPIRREDIIPIINAISTVLIFLIGLIPK